MRLLPLISVGCALLTAASTAHLRQRSVANATVDSATTSAMSPVPATTASLGGGVECRDHADRPGTCGTIRQCPVLLKLVSGGRRPTDEEIANLRASANGCGSLGKHVLVCCARESSGPFVGEPEDHPNRVALDANGCGGVLSGRIIGGADVSRGQFPWFASLGYRRPSDGGGEPSVTFECSGVLISERHVLTAAHCVAHLADGVRLSAVRLGQHQLDEQTDCASFGADVDSCTSTQDFQIAEIFIHADYNKPARRMNDIALLKLDRPVSLDRFAQTICLPFGDVGRQNYADNNLTAVGFASLANDAGLLLQGGRLQKLVLPGVEHDVCAERVRQLGALLGPRQLCAGGQPGRDLCFGDSGAPLMTSSSIGQYSVIGLVAYGHIACQGRVPGVFTRVSEYLNWILDRV